MPDETTILAALTAVDGELAEHGSLVPVMELHGAVGEDAMRMAVVRTVRIAQSAASDRPDGAGAHGELSREARTTVPLLAAQWILGCAVALAARPPHTGVDTARLAAAARRVDAGTGAGHAADADAGPDSDDVDVRVVRNVAADRAAAVVAVQRAAGGDVDADAAVGLAAAFVDGFMIGDVAARDDN